MTVTFDPQAARGQQYGIKLDNGQQHERISRYAVEGALLREGLSLSGIKAALSQARLERSASVL